MGMLLCHQQELCADILAFKHYGHLMRARAGLKNGLGFSRTCCGARDARLTAKMTFASWHFQLNGEFLVVGLPVQAACDQQALAEQCQYQGVWFA